MGGLPVIVPVMVLPNLLIVPKLLKVPAVFIDPALIFMVAPIVFVVVAPEAFVKKPCISSVSSLIKVLPEELFNPPPLIS